MDNALFHRKLEIDQITRIFGLRIILLPLYSFYLLYLNRIEELWASLKNG